MDKAAIDPMSMTVPEAARMLGVSEDIVREHVAAGLPETDGRINIVNYAAWLNVRRPDGA